MSMNGVEWRIEIGEENQITKLYLTFCLGTVSAKFEIRRDSVNYQAVNSRFKHPSGALQGPFADFRTFASSLDRPKAM